MMRIALELTTLVMGTLAATTAGADRSLRNVDAILNAWSNRASSVKTGEARWTIAAERRNRFGRFDTDWVPTSGPADRVITGRVQFDELRARYDSMTFSYADVGPSPARKRSEEEFFRAILGGGFVEAEAEYRDFLSYSILYSDTTRVHYWHGVSEDYSRAVILPVPPTVGSRLLTEYTALHVDSGDNPSGGPSAELHEWLAAPMILAFRPRLFDEGFFRDGACHVDENAKPVYEGRECRVLRVAALSKDSSSPLSAVEQVYWVDPSRDFLVVRCFLVVHGDGEGVLRTLAQLDIRYDRVPDLGWLPAEWTATRLGSSPFLVRQVAVARRTHVVLRTSAPDKKLDVEFSPGTWVKDTVAKRQFFVDGDLREQELPYAATYDYTYLVQRFGEKASDTPWYCSKNVRRALLGLVQWPGVLLPLATIVGALGAAKAARRLRQRVRPHATAVVDASPSSRQEGDGRQDETESAS